MFDDAAVFFAVSLAAVEIGPSVRPSVRSMALHFSSPDAVALGNGVAPPGGVGAADPGAVLPVGFSAAQ